ncbi:hypothetical protein GE09DRAFT_355383 [Coniochaeta sp. 2T2.1]|nr:hypothetical protein GE09DRAFT_355383 [Coniochaeta sp. 2T2.1]
MEEHQLSTAPPASVAEQLSAPESAPTFSPEPPAVEPLSRPPSRTDAPAPMAAMTEPISRPASTSTQTSASHAFNQLPGISSLQATPNTNQQHLGNYQQPITSKSIPFLPHNDYTRSSPASTAGPGGNGVVSPCTPYFLILILRQALRLLIRQCHSSKCPIPHFPSFLISTTIRD